MTDIVERLRDQAWRRSGAPKMEAGHTKLLEWEAAGEIKRLRVQIAVTEQEHQDFRLQNDREWHAKLDHLKDEIERLRKVCENTNAVIAATLHERDAEIAKLQAELEAVKETNQKQYDIILRQEQID